MCSILSSNQPDGLIKKETEFVSSTPKSSVNRSTESSSEYTCIDPSSFTDAISEVKSESESGTGLKLFFLFNLMKSKNMTKKTTSANMRMRKNFLDFMKDFIILPATFDYLYISGFIRFNTSAEIMPISNPVIKPAIKSTGK